MWNQYYWLRRINNASYKVGYITKYGYVFIWGVKIARLWFKINLTLLFFTVHLIRRHDVTWMFLLVPKCSIFEIAPLKNWIGGSTDHLGKRSCYFVIIKWTISWFVYRWRANLKQSDINVVVLNTNFNLRDLWFFYKKYNITFKDINYTWKSTWLFKSTFPVLLCFLSIVSNSNRWK